MIKLYLQPSSPLKFFLLLVYSLFFIFVSYCILFNYVIPLAFLIYISFFIYIPTCLYIYLKRYLLYFDAWFVMLFPLYYVLNTIFYLNLEVNVFGVSYEVFYKSCLLCFSTWLLVSIILLSRPKFYQENIFNKVELHSTKVFLLGNTKFLFFLGLGCSLFFMSKVSGLGNSGVLNSSRLELVNKIDDSGWYLKYFMISYCWYIFGLLTMSIKGNKFTASYFLLVVPIIIYFYSLLVVGSRREIVFSIIFLVLLLFILNKAVFNKKLKLFTLLSALSIFLLGFLRYSDNESINVLILNTFGEFMFPISTFIYHVSIDSGDYLYGSSYFNFITNFIPKYFYPEKPLPLAVEFAKLVSKPGQDFIMGYAFTPISEAFVNFGKYLIFIFPIVFVFLIAVMELIVVRYPLFLIVVLTQVVNFQRSDIASLIFELTLLFMCFLFCTFITRIRINVSDR